MDIVRSAHFQIVPWSSLYFYKIYRPLPMFTSVQFSRSVMSDSLWPHELQHARPPCPSPTPRVHSKSEVAQLCPTLCDPMDGSLPGSSIHGICQARVLEWGAITFSDICICIYIYIQWNTTQPKRKEILTFATTWMDWSVLCLVKWVRQRETNTIWYHLHVESEKWNKREYKRKETESQI